MSKEIEKLKFELAEYCIPQVVKDTGSSFIVFLTGWKFGNGKTVLIIGDMINEVAASKYPNIEVFKTEEHFLLLILKP